MVGPAPAGRDAMTELALEVVGVVDVSPSMRRRPSENARSPTSPMSRGRTSVSPSRSTTAWSGVATRSGAWTTNIAPSTSTSCCTATAPRRAGRRPRARTTPSPPSVPRQARDPARSRLAPPGRRRRRHPRHVGAPRAVPRPPRPPARGRGANHEQASARPLTWSPSAVRPWVIRHFSSTTCGRSSCPTATELSISTVSAV